jgi:DNA anti-recombination protein RmuC
VTVTGNLTVQGSNILQRIIHLEQAGIVGQLAQQLSALQSQLNTMQNQLNTAINNLTARITLTEIAISDLKARVTALGG